MDRNGHDGKVDHGGSQVPVAVVVSGGGSSTALTDSASNLAPAAASQTAEQVQIDMTALRRARCRLPFELLMYVAQVAVVVANLATFYVLIQDLGQQTDTASGLASTLPSAAAVAAYEGALGAAAPNGSLCDAQYLAGGYGTLQWQIKSLWQAAQAIWYISLLPNAVMIIYRFGHVRNLWAASQNVVLERVRRGGKTSFLRPGTNPDTNPVGRMNIGDVTVRGRIDAAERLSLRGETSAYLVMCLLQDIPQIMVFFLYTAFVNRYRGLECAQCLQEPQAQAGGLCFTESVWSLTDDRSVVVAMGGTFLSVAYNFTTTFVRWITYVLDMQPPWSVLKTFVAALIGLVAFAALLIAPNAVLFAAYLEPDYYFYWSNQAGFIALAAIAGVVAALGFLLFMVRVGLIPGDDMKLGLVWDNLEEMLYLALPCVVCCEACGLLVWCDCTQCCPADPHMCAGSFCPCCGC